MGSLYASLTGTCVLRQRYVPPPSVITAVWNGTAYVDRGWCNFEQGVARVAQAHVEMAALQLAQRETLEASVLATVRSLRRQLRAQPAEGDGGNPVLVASLDRSALNDASAALVDATVKKLFECRTAAGDVPTVLGAPRRAQCSSIVRMPTWPCAAPR